MKALIIFISFLTLSPQTFAKVEPKRKIASQEFVEAINIFSRFKKCSLDLNPTKSFSKESFSKCTEQYLSNHLLESMVCKLV